MVQNGDGRAGAPGLSSGPSSGPGPGPSGEVAVGEVVTGLLDSSVPLPLDAVREALGSGGQRVAWKENPVPRAVSPDLFIGVDCPLAAGRSGSKRVRGVGTVAARAVLTGGHVIQGSARTRALIGLSTGRHQDWSHYSERPGVIEVVKRATAEELADGFLEAPPDPELLDLHAVGTRVVDRVQGFSGLDHDARLMSRPARLRWAAVLSPEPIAPRADIESRDGGVYLVRLTVHVGQLEQAVEFCEVLALHHWLLATLKGTNERSTRTGHPIDELKLALEYLAHLWNPEAHLTSELRLLWQSLETTGPQFNWQWQTQVTRIRDRIVLLTHRTAEVGGR